MVLVNKTKMKVSVIKTDGNILAVKPESHIFVSKETIKSYPSFIEVFTDEEFNELNKNKEVEKSSSEKVKIEKVEKTTNVEEKVEEKIEKEIEKEIEKTKETTQTKAPRRRRKPKVETEKKESK